MAESKTYTHSKKTKFKHDVIHVDNAGELVKGMKEKAQKIGFPKTMPVSQLARAAITAWINT